MSILSTPIFYTIAGKTSLTGLSKVDIAWFYADMMELLTVQDREEFHTEAVHFFQKLLDRLSNMA